MKTVCITAMDDGTFAVELEPVKTAGEPVGMAEGSQPDAMDDMGEGEPAQTVTSIDEALSIAKSMLAGGEKPMMDGESDFLAGFANARGRNGGF